MIFDNHAVAHDYAEANGLDYAWEGTRAFSNRQAQLPVAQFTVYPVRTRRGITNIGLFSKEIARAEFIADEPRQYRLAERRLRLAKRRGEPWAQEHAE